VLLVACFWSRSAIRLELQHADELASVLLVELVDHRADVTRPRRGAARARRLPRRRRPRRDPRSVCTTSPPSVCTTSPPIAAAVDVAGVLLLVELGDRRADVTRPRRGDLELGAVCTTPPPIAPRPSSPPSCTKPADDRRRPPRALGHRGALVARVLSSPCDHQRPPARPPIAAAARSPAS
jgi:hypothetical protein